MSREDDVTELSSLPRPGAPPAVGLPPSELGRWGNWGSNGH